MIRAAQRKADRFDTNAIYAASVTISVFGSQLLLVGKS